MSQSPKRTSTTKKTTNDQPAQYKVNHLNDPITFIKELNSKLKIKSSNKWKPSRKKYFVEMVFTGEFYQNLKSNWVQFHNLFQKLDEWIIHSLFYEANFIQILKPDKSTKTNIHRNNCRPKPIWMYLVQIINIILTIRNHHYIKWFMHHDKRDFILGIQDWFSIQKSIHIINSIYRLRGRKNQTYIQCGNCI